MSYNYEYARFSIYNNFVNRSARSRQGRRPLSQQRPTGAFSGAPPQDQNTLQPPMMIQNTTNGAQTSQGVFSFGQQSNGLTQSFEQSPSTNPSPFPASNSFPPFSNSSNNSFSTQFPPKSSSFEFNIAKNTSFNNPFSFTNGNVSGIPSNAAKQSEGFQGSIFNIPPTASFSDGNAVVAKSADQSPFRWNSNVSSPKPQSQSPNEIFKSSKEEPASSPSSNPFGQFFSQQQSTTSLFGQNSITTATQNPSPSISDIFGQKSLPQTQNPSPQNVSNLFGQPNSPQTSSSANIFGPGTIPPKQPQQTNLFAPPDEDSMSTSPDSSPQSKDPTSRPFAFLNPQTEQNTSNSTKENTQGTSLFSRISQPGVSIPAAGSPEGNPPQPNPLDQSLQTSPTFSMLTKNASSGFPSSPTTAERDMQQTSPTRSNGFKAKPISTMLASEAEPAMNNPFGKLKLPEDSLSSPIGVQSESLAPINVQATNPIEYVETGREGTSLAGAQSSIPLSIFGHSAWGTPPAAPADYTDIERWQLLIGYQLKCLDAGLQYYISSNQSFHAESDAVNRFYAEMKEVISNSQGISYKTVAGGKRKSVFDEYEDQIQMKKTRFDDGETNNGGLITTSSTAQPLLTEPASLPQALNIKRKADGDLARANSSKDLHDGSKRFRGDSGLYPSLPSSSSSQTSNIFKNILDSKDVEISQNVLEPVLPDKQNGDTSSQSPNIRLDPSEPMIASKNTFEDQSRLRPSSITSESLEQNIPEFPTGGVSMKPSSSASKPEFAPASLQSETSYTGQNSFLDKPKLSNSASFSPAPPSSFELPKFNVAPVSFLSQFGKVAEDNTRKEKQSRKAQDFDSDEDDEAEWERKDAKEQLAKKKNLDDALQGKTAQFIPGKGFTLSKEDAGKGESGDVEVFGSLPGASIPSTPQGSGKSVLTRPSQGLVNGHNIFSHLSDAESGPEGSKTGDADDEDTESERGSEHDSENDRIDGTKPKEANQNSKSLPNSNPFGSSSTPSLNHGAKASTEAVDQTRSAGRSLFDRVSKDTDGNLIREVPLPTEKNKENLFKSTVQPPSNIFGQTSKGLGTSIFASSSAATPKGNMFGQPSSASNSDAVTPAPPSTPKSNTVGQVPAGTPTPIVGLSSSSGSDNTWKVNSPIKFGTSASNPSEIRITSPTPSKSSLGALFGSPQASLSTDKTLKLPTPSIFSTTPTKAPTDVGFGFNFGGPPKTGTLGSLAPPSNVASAATSRATSPGITTGGESANESNADEEAEKHEQLNLAARGPGEEDEDILFSAKAKAMSFDASTKSWPSQGVGMLRVLKHRESSKTRILMRQDPSGKIVLNAALLGTLSYEYSKPKAVKMAVATDAGKLSTWMIRVGKDEDAIELARILEANKSS